MYVVMCEMIKCVKIIKCLFVECVDVLGVFEVLVSDVRMVFKGKDGDDAWRARGEAYVYAYDLMFGDFR